MPEPQLPKIDENHVPILGLCAYLFKNMIALKI